MDRCLRTELLVGVLALLAAICLGAPAAEATPGKPARPLRDITLRLNWYPDGEHAYLYYGLEKGIFEKAGIRLVIAGGKGSSVSVKLVGNGNEDAGLVSADYVLTGLSKGLDVRSVMVLYHRNYVGVYSIADRGIKRLEDLYGKRVGVMLESYTYPLYLGACKLGHIDRSRIQEIPVNGQAAQRMLIDGQIDAHMWSPLNGTLPMRLKGFQVNEIPFDDYGVKMYGMCLVVGPTIMGDSDLVGRLKGAVVESLVAAQAHPNDALAAMHRSVRFSNPEIELAKLKLLLSWIFDESARRFGLGYQTIGGWKTSAETLHATGQLEDVLVYKKAIWSR